MTTASLTNDLVWSPVLDGLRADALDCLQANLAAIADRHHGPGTHHALGAELRFTTAPGPLGVPVVSPSLDDRLDQAARLLGLRVARRWDGVDGPAARRLAAEHAPLYVVADAYDMAWLPYAGREHMEHTFLLLAASPVCVIADGYFNTTQWGDMRPGTWELPESDVDAAVRSGSAMVIEPGPLPALDVPSLLSRNAAAMTAAVPAIESYVDTLRGRAGEVDVLAQLVLDIWVLARSRELHAVFVASAAESDTAVGSDTAVASDAAGEQAQRWRALAVQSYLALRKARRGTPVAPGLLDQLLATLLDTLMGDVRLAARLAPGVHEVVVAVARAVLGAEVELTTPLRSLPNYSSFRLIDIIERVQEVAGVEADPDRFTAERMRDLASLCAVFERTTA